MDDMENYYQDQLVPVTSITSGIGQELTNEIYCLPIQIVNCYFISNESDDWVLVDAGMPRSADTIIEASEDKFGKNSRPSAIILTHGHFDHVGAITDLVDHWKVPVFAHELELPYLTGKKSYPKGDPKVDGGLVSEMSPMFPNHSIDLNNHIKALPEDQNVPGLKGWQWIHTPGHTPGHVSLFNELNSALIAGDAFVTVKQESLYKVITQQQEISGPPKYFTTDWDKAWQSVKKLNDLQPSIAATGHGLAMSGNFLKHELQKLVDHFDSIAIPEHGRFVN